MPSTSQTVVVIGASDNPERYSYKAVKLLSAKGHRVIPIHPRLKEIEGIPVISRLEDVNVPIDTITLYVGPDISSKLTDAIVAKHPGRVIFNPGAENSALESAARSASIQTLNACTLVLLNTSQF